MKHLHLILVLVLLALPLAAQSSNPSLDFAFEQWRSNGPEPFAKALYGANAESAKQLSAQLAPMVRLRGEYQGYEVISRTKIGQKLERHIIVIHFEHAPLFMRLDLYEAAHARFFLPALVSREASDILPLDILSVAGK
jgi:hypothetical protein